MRKMTLFAIAGALMLGSPWLQSASAHCGSCESKSACGACSSLHLCSLCAHKSKCNTCGEKTACAEKTTCGEKHACGTCHLCSLCAHKSKCNTCGEKTACGEKHTCNPCHLCSLCHRNKCNTCAKPVACKPCETKCCHTEKVCETRMRTHYRLVSECTPVCRTKYVCRTDPCDPCKKERVATTEWHNKTTYRWVAECVPYTHTKTIRVCTRQVIEPAAMPEAAPSAPCGERIAPEETQATEPIPAPQS